MKDTTVTVTTVTPEATTTIKPAVKAKSWKGKWGKVGARPKDIKFPRGSYTIKELVAFQGVNAKGKPAICELTLRNYVTNTVHGFRIVKKKVDGKTVSAKVAVPMTIVQLPKNLEKDTVGRPNFRFMSKAAYDAVKKNGTIKKTPTNVTTPTAAPVEAVPA
jgi:hypothetical protein